MKHEIKKYFISGLLTILPLIILYTVFKSVAGIFSEFFPKLNMFFSLIISIFLILLLGFLISNFLSKKIKKIIKKKSDGKGIFSNIAKLFLNINILRENTKKIFEKPILYKVDDGIFELGYISNESFSFLNFEEKKSEAEPEDNSVWVYIPAPFTFMGSLKLVEKRKIKKIDKEKKEEISLFILSAGISKK